MLSGVFIVNFEHISRFILVFLLLTLSRLMPAGIVAKLDVQRQPREVFCEKPVLKIFTIFTEKHLCCRLFSIKKETPNLDVSKWILWNFQICESPWYALAFFLSRLVIHFTTCFLWYKIKDLPFFRISFRSLQVYHLYWKNRGKLGKLYIFKYNYLNFTKLNLPWLAKKIRKLCRVINNIM